MSTPNMATIMSTPNQASNSMSTPNILATMCPKATDLMCPKATDLMCPKAIDPADLMCPKAIDPATNIQANKSRYQADSTRYQAEIATTMCPNLATKKLFHATK